jgi:hypothetical protein
MQRPLVSVSRYSISLGLAVRMAESVSGMAIPSRPQQLGPTAFDVSRFLGRTRSTHKSTHKVSGFQGKGRELQAIKNRLIGRFF